MINDTQQKAMEAADEFYKPHDRGPNPSGIDYEIIDSIEDKKEGFKKGFLAGYSLANERIKELEGALHKVENYIKPLVGDGVPAWEEIIRITKKPFIEQKSKS